MDNGIWDPLNTTLSGDSYIRIDSGFVFGKSFIDAIGHDAARSIVTPHIIGMAHELKLAMIAEGVETPEQEAYLKNADVQFVQGWLYARALPAEQFRSFYRSRVHQTSV